MGKQEDWRLKNLRFVLRTKMSSDEIHRGVRRKRRLTITAGLLLLVMPLLIFRDLGYAGYVVGFLSGVGGALIFAGEFEYLATKKIEYLHEFIDFERLKAEVDRAGD